MLVCWCAAFSLWAGCADVSPSLSVAVHGEMVQLTDHSPMTHDVGVYDEVANQVNLFAAANETVSVQVLVGGGADGVSGVRVRMSELVLAGPGRNNPKLDAGAIKGFRMLPVRVSEFPPWHLRLVETPPRSEQFYDPLVPLDAPVGGQPYAVPAGDRLAVWFDIAVPRSAKAGVYRGTVRVEASGHAAWELPIAIKVYGFMLPDQRPIPALGSTDFASLCSTFIHRQGRPFVPANLDRNNADVMKGLVLLRQVMTLAHDHRLDLFDRTIRPAMGRDLSGNVTLDWDDYTAVVRPYLDGTAFEDRIGVPAWPMPVSEDWPRAEHYGGRTSEEFLATAGAIIAQARVKLGGGEFGRAMFHWPCRQGVSERAYADAAGLFAMVRQHDAETPIVSTLPARAPAESLLTIPPEMASVPAVLAPPGQWFDPSAARPGDGRGGVLSGAWLAPGTPPYVPSLGILATPADVRALPWMAMKYQCSAIFLGDVMNWEGEVFATAAGAEARLFYPGTVVGVEGVLPSVRLKRLRRGLTDLAYVRLLSQRGRPAVANGIVNAMVRYGGLEAAGDHYLDPRLGGWVHDGRQWEEARRLLAEEINTDIYPEESSRRDLLAQQMAWQNFLDATRTVRLEQCRPTVSPTETGLRATIRLEVYNEYNYDVTLTASLDALPKDWRAVTGEVRVSPLPAGARREIVLTAEGQDVPLTGDGKLPLHVMLTVDQQPPRGIDVGAPILQVTFVDTPIVIDGRLNDWPMRGGNAAGNFRLLGARGQGPEPVAQRQTLVFALRDDKYLYVAFRCLEPNPAGLMAKANNIIYYEQLMACGEDLVELILDPGMQAKGPEDLYHLVVKPNGVLLAEKGIHTDPPLGKAQPWPVAAKVAVSQDDRRWVVELAIPLDAFGPAGQEKFWGVNFARFSWQGQESSSWSAAPRYYYDPRNLGTLWMK